LRWNQEPGIHILLEFYSYPLFFLDSSFLARLLCICALFFFLRGLNLFWFFFLIPLFSWLLWVIFFFFVCFFSIVFFVYFPFFIDALPESLFMMKPRRCWFFSWHCVLLFAGVSSFPLLRKISPPFAFFANSPTAIYFYVVNIRHPLRHPPPSIYGVD